MFDDLAGTEHHRLERRIDPTHGHVGLGGEAQIHAFQHSATTDQVHALHDEILCELRRSLGETAHDRIHHRRDGFLDGNPDLVGREHHRLGQATHELTAADLGTDLVGGRIGRPQHDLDLLGGALTHRDAVLAADEPLNGVVDVERADSDCFERNDAAERDEGALGGAAPDVDHHVADRFVDRQISTDRSGNGLLDEAGIRSAGAARRLGHGSTFDGGDRRRHTDHDPWPVEPAHPDPLQQQPDHALGDLEVGDRPLAQRAHGHDVGRGAADHLPRLVAHRQNLTGPTVERDHRGLVQDDALTSCVHQRVGGAEINRKVACQGQVSSTAVSSRRTIPLGCGWGRDRSSGARTRSCSWKPDSTGRRRRDHSHNSTEPSVAARNGKTRKTTASLTTSAPVQCR